MNKTALQDIQKTLNIIRNQIDAVDADTKWAVLELMLASSASVAALSKKMTKPDTKQSLAQSLFPKQKSSNSLLSKQANKQTRCERRSLDCYQTHHFPKTVTQSINPLISV